MMKKSMCAAIAGLTILLSSAFAAQTIDGAGASFPAPVYQNWTYTFSQSSKDITVNYQSVGSGAGINQIKAKTVDFAGTDNPLTSEEQERDGLVQFPMLMGGVVVIVNLPNVADGELKLSRQALADIYLGKITAWNHPAIRATNPTLKLPRMKITVVRRADASGTSFIFTNYLSKISKEWADQVGAGASVQWPVGIGGQKNPGVCNNVAKIRGSIGYTEYTYAVEAKITSAQLENRAGVYVKPTVETFMASAVNADWQNAPGYYMVLTDQDGTDSWPLTGVTYILIRKDCPAPVRDAIKTYVNWCFTTGATAAKRRNYVPMPENVIKLIQNTVLN